MFENVPLPRGFANHSYHLPLLEYGSRIGSMKRLLVIILFCSCVVPCAYGEAITFGKSGGTYTGEIFNGVPHGKGVLSFPDGSKYAGEWRDGMPHGQGTWTQAKKSGIVPTLPAPDLQVVDNPYEPLPVPDVKEYGVLKYVGKWQQDSTHVQGVYKGGSSTKYVGEWKNGSLWNGLQYDKDRRITATFSEGVRYPQ